MHRAIWRTRAAYAWPLVQGTAAATAAWAIARHLETDHDPFFAPIAAFIALNAPLGERGLNAVRLVTGVIVGIVAGELTLLVLGSGYVELALATFAATLAARALGETRIVIAQAAVAAILTISLGNGEAGLYRLADALVGTAVALGFSQLLFSPEPLALLRRAESAALGNLADALSMTAHALEHDDPEADARAVMRMRDLRDQLGELGRVRRVSERVARRSAVWRSQRAPVVTERENAGHLDLLAGSCLMLTRAAVVADEGVRHRLAPIVRELALAIADVAPDPGDQGRRQRLADQALAGARRMATEEGPGGSSPALPVAIGGIVAMDLMTFAGADPDEALAAVREGVHRVEVPTPPAVPRSPMHVGARRRGALRAMASLRAAAQRLRRRARDPD